MTDELSMPTRTSAWSRLERAISAGRAPSRPSRACEEMLTRPAEQDAWLAYVATTLAAP